MGDGQPTPPQCAGYVGVEEPIAPGVMSGREQTVRSAGFANNVGRGGVFGRCAFVVDVVALRAGERNTDRDAVGVSGDGPLVAELGRSEQGFRRFLTTAQCFVDRSVAEQRWPRHAGLPLVAAVLFGARLREPGLHG